MIQEDKGLNIKVRVIGYPLLGSGTFGLQIMLVLVDVLMS